MRLLVVQHDHVSPLGPVAERFTDHGYDLTHHLVVPPDRFDDPGVAPDFPEFTRFDSVVLMGAPWSVYAEPVSSWVEPERGCIRNADAAGVPILGICFGGQLLASTFGGAVVPSKRPEIGWTEVSSDDEAIVPSGPWFQWHSDRWEPPPAAREVARNAAASQAFVLGHHLAVQFHPELNGAMLAGWLDNGGATMCAAFGASPQDLMEATRRREPTARERAHRLVDGFLRLTAQHTPSHEEIR